MRILNMNINGFGVFTDLKLEGLASGLNVFVGNNEAGKSTLLEFVRNVLFGYPTGKESRKYLKHPTAPGAKPGGSLVLQLADDRVWELFWQPKTGPGLHSLFEYASNNLQELDITQYKQLTGEMTRQLYASVYGFSLDELQRLSSLEDDARVADLLYGAGFGLGNLSLPEIMKTLSEKHKDEIWLPRGQKQALNSILAELKETQQKIQTRQEYLPRFNQIKSELEKIRAKLTQIQAGLELARAELAANRDLINLKNQLPELLALHDQLDTLEKLALPPETEHFFAEHSLEKLKNWEQGRVELQEKLNNIGKEQAELAIELAQDSAVSAVLAAGAEIKELQEEKGRYQAELEELARINPKLAALTGQPAFTALFDHAVRADTHLLAARINHVLKGWQELFPLITEWHLLIQSMKGSATASPTQQNPANFLSPANPAILLLGLASSAALAYGLYSSVADSHWIWAGLAVVWTGLGGLFIAARNIRSEKGYELELHALEEQKITVLAAKARPLIEALRPLLEQVILLQEGPLEQDDSVVLSSLEALTPAKCLELESLLLEWHGRLPGLIERKAALNASLQTIEQKSIALMCRLFPDCQPGSGSYLSNLQSLTLAQEKAQQGQLLESKIRGRLEALASQQHETLAALEEVKAQLESALQITAAGNLDELEKLYSNWEKKRDLASKANTLGQRLLYQATEIIKQIPPSQNFIPQERMHPEALLNWLESMELSGLQTRHNKLESDRRLFEQEHEQLARAQGELSQETKSLMAEDELETLGLEREMLLEKARKLTRQWSVASLALHYLTEAKRAFEAKHQTEVMREASAFFQEITGGAYLGLDPSAPENSFAVLTANGESLSPEALSRGTREQLYLALRLALIKNRGNCAEPFPLLMDDVLVNFDPARLRRAVDAILALASTHQILYFTCQPHLVPELFDRTRANGVDSRLFEIKNGVVNPAGTH